MEQRRTPNAVTGNVIAALAATGTTLNTLAEATDISSSTLRERLDNPSTFTWDELCRVGGLFSVHPANLMAGAL